MTDLPEWLYVGAPVATYNLGSSGSFGIGGWSTTTVTKIGKRDIVLANGSRFNVSSLTHRSGETWGATTSYLVSRTDENFLRVKREKAIRRSAQEVSVLMDDWLRERGELEPVREAIEILSRYLSADEIARG